MALVVLVIGYLTYFFAPIYWPLFQLGGIMRGICNDAYRITKDEQLMDRLLEQSKRTGLDLTEDNFRLTRIQWSDEELQELAGDNQRRREMLESRGKECLLEMHYEDDYEWPFIGKSSHFAFDSSATAPLEQIKWEKQCTCVTPGPTS